jgi:hypothetical protein
VLRPALERGGDSPKGRQDWPLDGLAEVIWVVGSSLHQAMIMRGVIYGLWVRLCFIVLRKMGFFPGYQGTLMTVPDGSSRASAVVSVRNSQRMTLTDGTLSLLVAMLFCGGALAHPRV